MWNYPVVLTTDDNTTILVTFPDIPEAITFGEDRDEALMRAEDALETALEMYIAQRRDLPLASPAKGRPIVSPSAQSCAKLEVYKAMKTAGLRKTDLAKRLGWHLPQVDRLLDLHHASRFEQIEAALSALGKHLIVKAA